MRMIRFSLLIFLLLLPFASAKVFTVELDYHHGDIDFSSVYVSAGDYREQEGDYRFETISFEKKILSSGNFPVEQILIVLPELSSAREEDLEEYGVTEEDIRLDSLVEDSHASEDHSDVLDEDEINHQLIVESAVVRFKAPYTPDTKEIFVYDPEGKKLLTIGTQQFSDTCGNSLCDNHESFENCKQDCASGQEDGFCDSQLDGKCDPDCAPTQDGDCIVERSEEQVNYEKQFLCNSDGLCGPGEDQVNCAVDCGSADQDTLPLVTLLVLFVFILSLLAMRRKRR